MKPKRRVRGEPAPPA